MIPYTCGISVADPESEPLDDEGYSSDGPLDAYATHPPSSEN
jgi:hypothetical protein